MRRCFTFLLLPFLCCGQASSDAVETYNLAVGLFERGRYALAAEQFQSFLKEAPDHEMAPEAAYWVGECLFQEEKADEAEIWFGKGADEVGVHSMRGPSWVRWAECAEKRGDLKDALARYGRSLQGEWTLPPRWRDMALLGRGDCLMELKRFEEAEKAFLQAAAEGQAEETKAYGFYSAGWAARDANASDRAAKHFQAVLDEYGDSEYAADASYAMAEALLDSRELDVAIEVLKALLKEGREDAQVLFSLGKATFEGGEMEKAKTYFLKAAEAGEGTVLQGEAFFNWGVCLTQMGQHLGAAEAYAKSVAAGPEGSRQRAYYWQGLSLVRGGEKEQAFGVLEKASKGEDLALACLSELSLGELYLEKDSLNEALAAYDKALAFEEVRGEALYGKGATLLRMGRGEEAIKLLREVWEERPEIRAAPKAALGEGQHHLAQGDVDEARVCFEAVLEKWPETDAGPDASLGLGWCLYREDRFQEAAKAFRRAGDALKGAPQEQEAFYMTGTCLLASGEGENALEPLRRAVTGDDASLSEKARVRLGETLCGLERYEEAKDVLSELPEDHGEGLLWRGWCLEKLGENEGAVEVYRQLLVKRDLSSREGTTVKIDATLGLARALEAIGDEDNALDVLRSFVKEFPDHSETSRALFKLGEALFQSEAYAQALHRFEQALQAKGAEEILDKILYRAGWCHRKLENTGESAPFFKRLLLERPESELAPEAACLAAEGFLARDDGMSALACAELFHDLELENSPAWVNQMAFLKGCALALLGEFEEAEKALAPTLEKEDSPQAFRAALSLAKGFRGEGDPVKAAEYFALAAQRTQGKEVWECFMSSGESLGQAGAHQDAALAYLRVCLLSQDEELGPRAGLLAADAFLKAGKGEEAAKALQALVKQYPQSDAAKEAKERYSTSPIFSMPRSQ